MPCYRCTARQTDPGRGASPWKRGVRAGVQVLICPTCQRTTDWTAELDRCPSCGSTLLVRRLGTTTCRQCGVDVADQGEAASPPAAAGLAEEVAAALDRLFRRTPTAPAGARALEDGDGKVTGRPGA